MSVSDLHTRAKKIAWHGSMTENNGMGNTKTSTVRIADQVKVGNFVKLAEAGPMPQVMRASVQQVIGLRIRSGRLELWQVPVRQHAPCGGGVAKVLCRSVGSQVEREARPHLPQR